MPRPLRFISSVLMVVVLAIGATAAAAAQATPTAPQTFTEPPQSVELSFDPTIDLQTVQLIVIAPNGARADDGFSRTTAIDTRSTLLRAGLGDGVYLVYWISGPAGQRAEQFGHETFTVSGSTPCVADGTATPPAETCLTDPPTGQPGTAIVNNGISVTVQVSSDKAGPVDLSVTATDASGAPVEGATVVVRARHLEMDHGELPYLATETAPGVYDASGVGMGMGGAWRIAVDVTRPDQLPVTVFVDQTMVE